MTGIEPSETGIEPSEESASSRTRAQEGKTLLEVFSAAEGAGQGHVTSRTHPGTSTTHPENSELASLAEEYAPKACAPANPQEWLERSIVRALGQVVEQIELVDSGADERTRDVEQAQITWAIAHGQAEGLLDLTEGMPRAGLPLRLVAPLDATRLLHTRLAALGPEVVAAITTLELPLVQTAEAIGIWLRTLNTCLSPKTTNKRRRAMLATMKRRLSPARGRARTCGRTTRA